MVRGWGVGLLHMTAREFGETRVGIFYEALWAYRQEKEADRRHLGELIRGATIRLFNTQVGKRSRVTDLDKFWRMPWDDDRPTLADAVAALDSMTDEERLVSAEALLAKFDNDGTTSKSQDSNIG
jgi:hypothetical protein